MNKTGDSLIKNGERLKTFGNGLSSMGTTLTTSVTAPIMAGTIAVTKAAIDWESAFTGVKKNSQRNGRCKRKCNLFLR